MRTRLDLTSLFPTLSHTSSRTSSKRCPSRSFCSALVLFAVFIFVSSLVQAAEPIVELNGADLEGGAKSHFGTTFYGQQQVNYVYAKSTGETATMRAALRLDAVPTEPLFLYLEAMDDDPPGQCHVHVSLNGRDLLRGPSGFPDGQWLGRRFPIPSDVLKPGSNSLVIANEQAQGALGAPPWFMVARVVLAGADYKMRRVEPPTLRVQLPDQERPLPEPLTGGHTEPGFKFRGTKGWAWTPEQYLAEIPYLAKFKMNFLMNCYLSMFTSAPGEPFKNEWWKPMTPARKDAYAQVIRACRDQGITFCFAVHPQLGSPRPLNLTSQEDLEAFYQHYAWAQSQGVHWFSVSLDDVSWDVGSAAAGGAAHARLVNTIFGRLRSNDPHAQLIFCPGPYWGDGSDPHARPYLQSLGRDLHPDVYVFWTGDGVVTQHITRKAAESYRRTVNHRLFLWDNYPVNDGSATLHLGPVSGRETGLCDVIDGYMSNPMCPQNQINRLPLATCADYAYNPWAYDPSRSIGQAILHLAQTPAQCEVLKDLVEAYPGLIVTGGGTGTNPVRSKFAALTSNDESRTEARAFLQGLEDVQTRLAEAFPAQFTAARKTIAGDVAWMKQKLQP